MTTTQFYCEQVEINGFAIVPGIVPPQELGRIAENIDHSEIPRSRAGIRHALRLESIAQLAHCTELTQLAREVLGPEAFPFRATLFDKSPDSNWLVVWHQDTALPLQQRSEIAGWGPWSVKEGIDYAHAPANVLSQILALRIHLDDSTASNGPLRVLPGTHTCGVLTDDAIHELTNRATPVDCPVEKGGVLAMRPLIVHSSSKSHSDAARRVLHIEYAASPLIAQPHDLAVA